MTITEPLSTNRTYSAYEPVATFTTSSSHAPTYNIIDLDYPLFGTTVVKCGGRKFDLEVVKKALDLAYEMNKKLAR